MRNATKSRRCPMSLTRDERDSRDSRDLRDSRDERDLRDEVPCKRHGTSVAKLSFPTRKKHKKEYIQANFLFVTNVLSKKGGSTDYES